MARPLTGLRKVINDGPPRIVIYGPAGIGKTTLASEFRDAVFIQACEDGAPEGVELASLGTLDTYGDVMNAIVDLQESDHNFMWAVLDSFSSNTMQRLIFDETCIRGDEHGKSKSSIEDFGYGKGYAKSLQVTQELLDELAKLRRMRGMGLIFLSHSNITTMKPPDSVSYDRYGLDLYKDIVGMVERDVDAVLFLKTRVSFQEEDLGFKKKRSIAKGGSTVFVHANPNPAHMAKNRYGISDFIYERGNGFAELAKYLPPQYAVADSEQAA